MRLGEIASFREGEGEPPLFATSSHVANIIQSVRAAVQGGKQILIARVLVGNIDGSGAIRRNRRVILWDSTGHNARRTPVPTNVGAILTMRWISHHEHAYLLDEARARGIFMTPQHLNTGELKQILRGVFDDPVDVEPQPASPVEPAPVASVAVEEPPAIAPADEDRSTHEVATAPTEKTKLKQLATFLLQEADFTAPSPTREAERLYPLAVKAGMPNTTVQSIATKFRQLRDTQLVGIPTLPTMEQAATPKGRVSAVQERPKEKTKEKTKKTDTPAAPVHTALEGALAALAQATQAIERAYAAVAAAQVEAERAVVAEVESRMLDALAETMQKYRSKEAR